MIEKLLTSDKLRELAHALEQNESILIEELWNAPKALIAAVAQLVTGKHVLILTGAGQEEARLFHDFPFFTQRPCIDFPAWETLPSENIPPSPDIVGERYQALQQVLNSSEPYVILSSLQACLQKLIPPGQYQDLRICLKVGQEYGFDALIQKLTEMGYLRCGVVTDKGEFAVRGGIIDVFPVSSPEPCRLEFFGDEISSLRLFDPVGQKSIQNIEEIEIPPARELEFLKASTKLADILDYLGPKTLVIFDDLLALEDRYTSLLSIAGGDSAHFSSIHAFMEKISGLQKIYLAQTPIEELSSVHIEWQKGRGYYSEQAPIHSIDFNMFNQEIRALRWRHPFMQVPDYLCPEMEEVTGKDILRSLDKIATSDVSLYFICSTEAEEGHLQKQILDEMIRVPKHSHYKIGYLSSGLVMKDIELILLPMTELTHRYKLRRQKLRGTYHSQPQDTYDLAPGEMIVHFNHGIGRYLGLEKRPNNEGVMGEFFHVEYAENAKLFVPINQAYLISKYIGASEEIPKMHTLGGTRWRKARDHTQQAIMGYATELLDMYAKRSVKGGFSYPEDTHDMHAFEEEFPFVETEDQLEAIAAIKQDMKSQKSMDRLICGDVGYGKTEVALRAAFKAAAEGGKQVAVLVPTTVLAMQHFENFEDRMANFPVKIGVLSRFKTPKEIKETLKGLAEGSVDIVIGTHRIISEDVVFKDLGLIIIDEEQRFGVKAKEHLKKIKVGVDCLTLSATPIPRTLYMSLVGARDMSVINTPPQDRLPIKTVITEWNDQTLKNALMRELARDGQAFIIHNRVETIFDVSAKVQKLLPQARIVVGHGQMSSDEIDSVFHAFKSGRADILIATTIIENGIDIPNANTIIVDRADRFGLADLYQLRGRVGRWNRRAYAYFCVPSLRVLPELSRKRLNALGETSGYGGGMKIAMRDLELRGAGDILGIEQSGHVASIGFHLYCKMLKRTIQTLQGKIPVNVMDTRLEIPVDARLPEEYVSEASLRMEMYQRLGEALSFEEVDAIWDELKDRFGPPPMQAEWLYYFTRIRVQAAQKGYTLIKVEKTSVTLDKPNSTRKVMFSMPKKPQEFEAKLIKILNE